MKDMQVIEDLYHHAATAAGDEAAHNRVMLGRGKRLAAFALDQLAATQRAVLDRAEVERFRIPSGQVTRPGLLAMTRVALVAHLERLEAALCGQLVLQHRDLQAMTDEDLRSLAADIEALVGTSHDEPKE